MLSSESVSDLATSLTGKRVYSEPFAADGVTIITAAAIQGGGGLRQGNGGEQRRGLGLRARPVGAYVLNEGHVRWKPALDISRIVLRGQLVALAALIVLGLFGLRRGARS